MGTSGVDDDDADGELMIVTGRALAKYGIAELTTQRIADEWGKSQSLVHYYYETKEDLVVAYVGWLRDQTVENYARQADQPPLDRIEWFLFRHFTGPHDPEEPAFSTGLVQLQAAAPYDDRLRAALAELDEAAIDFLRTAVQDGIDSGDFRAVEIDQVVDHLLAWLSGAIQRSVTLRDTTDIEALKSGMEAYLDSVLLENPQYR